MCVRNDHDSDAVAPMARRIKRYENRKLYDTEASQYVSLSDIAELVRAGETVEVIDNASGDDLTAQTLTQIILEEGREGHHVLPSELLHTVLRRSGEALDVGFDQIRSTIDDLVQTSLGRFRRLVSGPQADELDELRTKLRMLERQLSDLLDRHDDRATANGDTSDARRSDPTAS